MTDLQLYSYLYGFFGTDGSPLTWGDGKLKAITLEVSIKDAEDIKSICEKLNGTVTTRERDTNFSNNYQSINLYTSNKELIAFLIKNDFPISDKTNTIHKPTDEYDEDYFWLGVIDGDGSLGMKGDGHPYINLTTKSEQLKEDFLDYIEKLTNFRPSVNKNKRDNIYNITVGSKKAQIIAERLYKDKEIGLKRKINQYLLLKEWQPKNMKGVVRLPWTKEEEEDLLKLSLEDFMAKYPNRTFIAIKGKKQRMKRQV